MKRLTRAIEILAWAGFFAVALTVLAVRFWVLPDIERYREDIVAAVSRTVGQPVTIGRIEAGWLGINPQVNLYDVRVFDAQGREALRLPAVENTIGWRSLAMGELRLHALAIDGPRLAVRRDPQGDVYVAGMKLAPQAGRGRREGGFAGWVLAQPEIEIRNAEVEWRDELRGAPPLALSGLSFRLRNTLWEHAAGLSARVPAALGTTLDVRAELSGRSLADPNAWRGRVYVETGYTDFAGWRPWIDLPAQLGQGHGAARLWATLEGGALAALAADLHVADLVPGMQPIDLRLSWQPAGRRPARGSLATAQVELESLAQAAQVLPLPEAARQRLAATAPRGTLRDVKLDWEGEPDAPAKVSGRARFAGLSMSAHERLPGFSGLSGSFEASEARGTLTLEAKKGELVLPELFPEPRFEFDTLSAQVAWEVGGAGAQAGGWSVKLGSFAIANADVDARASGTYANPGFGRGTIDLSAEVRRADGRHVARYLPLPEIMGPNTRRYLASSIKAAEGRDARLRLRGDLEHFPFTDPSRGEFQVTARIEKGVVEPGAGWPQMRDVEAQLLFERDRMEIVGRATVEGARLSNVRVAIPELSAAQPRLVASGHAEGTLDQFLKFVDASPMQRTLGGFTGAMSAAGRGDLVLKVAFPIGETARAEVAGEFGLAASKIVAHPQLPPIERASARIAFTESTVSVREGRGRLLGGALSVSGGTRPGGAVEIVARGDASVAALQPMLDPAWRPHFSGAAPYTATLAFRDGRSRVTIDSSLRGLASALPPPLAKGAADALPLRVDLFPAEGGRDRVSVQLGTLAHAELLRRRDGDGMAVQRASVWLSPRPGEQARVPERGVLVYGSLATLDADRWLALFADEQIGVRHRTPTASSVSDPDLDSLPVAFDLKVGTLDAYGRRMHDLAMQGRIEAGGWSAKVQAAELAGDVSYHREKGGQLVARLAHLTVPADAPGAARAPAGDAAAPARELPAVDLVAERFVVKQRELGRLELAAAREEPNWRIHKVALANADGALTGQGLWRTGPKSYTALNLDLDAVDAGRLLARLGYPDVVRGSHTKMQAQVSWDGDPVTIHYPSLSGELQLQADDGQFLEVDPGIGKLLSIMSLQQLPKRLTLDFRDVFSRGFQFDRIRAAANIENGLMTLKDFEMRGAAAEVGMTGQVDLAKETQALRVRVVPQLGDTASTALLFVNPFLFFPAAIAQRILKDPLGHIFAFNYAVSGSWADPKIERTRVDAQPVREEALPDGGGAKQ
jgi:uncharacterized protein (TIGR02099 family)